MFEAIGKFFEAINFLLNSLLRIARMADLKSAQWEKEFEAELAAESNKPSQPATPKGKQAKS